MRVLVVVDMQKDFVTGSLGSPEAQAIIPNVFSKVSEYVKLGNYKAVRSNDNTTVFGLDNNDNVQICFTRDQHDKETYMESEEGKKLPVLHCIANSGGDDLIPEFEYFKKYGHTFNTFYKETFGSLELADYLTALDNKIGIESVEIIGVCTDICVISNAIIAKSAVSTNVPIYVDASCCAGSSRLAHFDAIKLMKEHLHINIINEDCEPWL